MKQIERRDCFDVENLAKHLIRFRPGAFTNEMCFFVMIATAFRIATLGGWSTAEVSKYFWITPYFCFRFKKKLTVNRNFRLIVTRKVRNFDFFDYCHFFGLPATYLIIVIV